MSPFLLTKYDAFDWKICVKDRRSDFLVIFRSVMKFHVAVTIKPSQPDQLFRALYLSRRKTDQRWKKLAT